MEPPTKLDPINIQAMLNRSLFDWYPQLLSSSCTCELWQRRVFRWSEHFVFQIRGTLDQDRRILVKVLHEKDEKGRIQDSEDRPSQSARLEYDALLSIYKRVNKEIEEITAVRPLACYSDHNALALEYLPGNHLLSILRKAGSVWSNRHERQIAEQTAYNSGRLLRIIHGIPKKLYPRFQIFDHDTYFARLEAKTRALLSLEDMKSVREGCARTQYLLEQLLNHWRKEVMVSHLHGDYYPENIVCLPDGRVFTVDTTLHQIGPVEQDLAKFTIGINLTKDRLLFGPVGMRPSVQKNVICAFLRGYRSLGNYNRRVLFAFQVLALLQRWIEILEVTRNQAPSHLSTLIRITRITPLMQHELEALQMKIRREAKLND